MIKAAILLSVLSLACFGVTIPPEGGNGPKLHIASIPPIPPEGSNGPKIR
jgi:hypothetical protein